MKTIYASESKRVDHIGPHTVTEFRHTPVGPIAFIDPWPSRSKPTDGRRYVTFDCVRYRVEWLAPADVTPQGTPE